MQNKSNELAELTANLKLSYSKNFEYYLKEVWIDLINRRIKNANDPIKLKTIQNIPGITKYIFSKYYSLPGIIGDRLFRVFDSNNNGILELNEFKGGMISLFCGDYEKTLRFIFDFYDFDGNGKISKEDIKIVLLYILYSNKDLNLSNKNDNSNNNNIIINSNNNSYETQIDEMLNVCFNKKKGIDFTSFVDIIEKINADIYFITYMFLLKQKPFSYKSLELYGHNTIGENNFNELYYPETTRNYKTGKLAFLTKKINKNPVHPFLLKNYYSETNNNMSFKNLKLNDGDNYYSETFVGLNIHRSPTNFFFQNKNKNKGGLITEKMTDNNLFDQNLFKTIYEAKIPNDLLESLNNIKYDENDFNHKEDQDIKGNLESEKNNYSGYVYKIKDGQMVKIFFKLFYKDLFYYKDESDTRHKGMYNLSGLFLKEEPTKILYDITYYSFSIIFPKKKRTYFCDNKQEFKGWKKCLRVATNYSNILHMYEITQEIGKGSFSIVRLARNKVTNQKVAVKIVTKSKLSSPILESTLTEIEIMKICQFPYIIKFIEAYETMEFIYIFMEYCPGGTLFNFLKKRDYNLNEKLCCNIIYKICLAVNYFHSYGIAHRDLKLDNVLMTSEDDEADIRILDFGLGKIIGPNEKCIEPYGTVIYCAPEIILCQPYTKIVDSWSIGIIAYILLFGRIPFYDESKSVIRKLIVKSKPVFKGADLPSVSVYAINFMQKFLTKDPDKRMTVEQALKHKWFQVFNKENIMKINQSINTKLNENKNINNIMQYFYQK